eukprot:2478844-Pleurochrysis_carterae.AAC.1
MSPRMSFRKERFLWSEYRCWKSIGRNRPSAPHSQTMRCAAHARLAPFGWAMVRNAPSPRMR